jgi:hypothetical protein
LRISQTYQSGTGLQRLKDFGAFDQLEVVILDPSVSLDRGVGPIAKEAIESRLESLGWSIRMRIDPELRAEVNAFHPSGIALQVQMGNVARAFYDLMKLQRLFDLEMISVGVLIVPMKSAAVKIGSNLASFERLSEEHELMFRSQINAPLVIFGIS